MAERQGCGHEFSVIVKYEHRSGSFCALCVSRNQRELHDAAMEIWRNESEADESRDAARRILKTGHVYVTEEDYLEDFPPVA